MFRIDISNVTDYEIVVSGDGDLVNELRELVRKEAWIHRYHQYGCVTAEGVKNHASFTMGLWNLKSQINGCDIAQIFLNFIKKNNIQLPDREQYLLQYWAFEITKINNKESYRAKLPSTSRHLLSAEKINTILDRCKKHHYVPSAEDLFNLFEKSEAMKGNSAYCQPLMPWEYEIQAFEKGKEQNQLQIEKSLIRTPIPLNFPLKKDSGCLFFSFPKEMKPQGSNLTNNTLLAKDNSVNPPPTIRSGKM